MTDPALLAACLDSLKDPFVFVDDAHVIRYLNAAAIAHHEGGADLLGASIFDCHNERSGEVIREVFAALQAGEEERLITDTKKHRVWMRAVRDRAGRLIGYYERYAPPGSRQ